jgi:hypothetical protein
VLKRSIILFIALIYSWTGILTATAVDDAAKITDHNPRDGLTLGSPVLKGIRAPTAQSVEDFLVFSAPPRETLEEGRQIYQPIAEYLSRVSGKKIVYKHPGNWLTYQTEMQRGKYDLVFDGPHFNSWRIANLKHNTLARIPDEHLFVVVVDKQNNHIRSMKQLVGQKVCGMNPPNLGTLALLGQFENPMRQPLIINSVGWKKVYEGVTLDKKCDAGVLPIANLKKFDPSGTTTRLLFKTKPLPNQAFSAGPRISREDQVRIATALTSPVGDAATARLRAAYGTEQRFVSAAHEDYAGIDIYLKDVWGYTR